MYYLKKPLLLNLFAIYSNDLLFLIDSYFEYPNVKNFVTISPNSLYRLSNSVIIALLSSSSLASSLIK